jgi:hypothetical protein
MVNNDVKSGVSLPVNFQSADVSSKDYATLKARFSLLGHVLQRNRRADDGRCTYVVGRWGQARHFTHLHDVIAFLAQIGGSNA